MSVKAIFPSISISKKKPKSNLAGSPQAPQLLPFLRPLTPESRRKQAVSNSNEPLRAFPPSSSPISASSLALRPNSSEINLASLDNGAQLSRSTPDLRFGLRQFRSASQPSRPTNSLRDRESFSSVTLPPDRSHSLNNDSNYFIDVVEAPMIEQEDIIALTHHVRNFSEALSSLRNTFMECEENPEGEPPEVKAHERLGEVLSVLKEVLNKYQPLNSTDILASAGTLINKVKSHNYEDESKVPDEFYESIDQLALAFSSSVSDFLMGEQDMVLTESMNDGRSRSLESYNDDDLEDNMGMLDVDEQGYEEGSEDDHDGIDDKEERRASEKKESVDTSAEKADELDKALIQLEHGIDIAMQRTKIWTKYSKDIATYVDRRAHLELDYTNKLTKLAQATRAAVAEENYLPFQSIFMTALDQDIDYAENANRTYTALLQNRFMEPLTGRRNKHDRTRKDLKDTWTKASKKLNESLVNLEKAKKLYVQKQQDLEKSKPSEGGGKDELLSSATLSAFARGTKKKEGDIRKADEAEEIYKQCVAEANTRQKELEATKAQILVELRQLIYQCDMTMKAVTCNYFQMMSTLASPVPIQYQTLADSSRMYEPGSQFADFVRLQQANSTPAIERVYQFEPFTMGGWSDRSQQTPSRHNSLFETRSQSAQTPVEENVSSSTHQPIKAWNSKDNNSDNDSITSRSLPGSPTHSPPETRKNARLPRARSLELVSSDDGAKERDDKGDMAKRNGPDTRKRHSKPRSSAGPFHSSRLSLAAQTHTLKKLRSSSRCRCCDSYVYFYNGAECEVCGMTCHKKCLGQLKVKCGTHQRSGRRMTTFGVDINQHIQDSSTKEENVPFILSSCINEIDRRGLDVKGIYRVSGVKSKVEVLCQSFESGQDYADLTDIPPHVIAAVLKLYIRQLPEPLLTFKLYPDFIRIAKESFTLINNATTCKQASEDEDLREEYEKLLDKLREVIMRLPKTNRLTTVRLIKHLKKVSEHEQANAMPGSNLAIVFGPTLLRPCDTTSTLSSLVDMPHQSRLVELLITNPEVFKLPEDVEPDTPVEEFTPPNPRDRDGSVFTMQSLRSSGNNPDESYEAEDEASFINTPDTHRSLPVTELSSDIRKSSLSVSTSGPRSPNNITMSPPTSSRSSLGFGSDFFDLLAKSNNRTDMQPNQSVPDFLLPGSLHDQPGPLGEDSDLEDEFEDDTTQGTSGSRTPDDELETSHFGGSKRTSAVSVSYENLTEDKLSSPAESSPSLPEPSIISPSSSLYSFAPSFSSDFPDTDSLLPDLSDSVGSGKFNSPKGMALSETSAGTFDPQFHLFSGTIERPMRPRHLALVKRNSDLPGRVQRTDEFSLGFYPIGIKPSISDPDLNKDPYIIEEEPQFRMVSGMASCVDNVERFEVDEDLSVGKDLVADRGNELRSLQDECPIQIDVGKDEVCRLEIGQKECSPLPSPLTEKTTENPTSPEKELPPVLKKANEFATLDEDVSTNEQAAADASRELIIPVMTALQERRPSTPNCSAVQASAVAVGASTERTRNEVEEKRQEAKAKSRLPYTRVSVKDRLQQYEKGSSGSLDSSRKTPEWASVNTVASRKEMFETREKSGDRVLYKRISDMGKKQPGSDSGSGSGSASGSPKIQRHRLPKVEDGTHKKAGESSFHTGLLKSQSVDDPQCQLKEKSENSERPRSLILYRVHVDKTDSEKSERTQGLESLKPGVFERVKDTLTPREIDIPLDSEVGERSDRPRKSPNTSPRSSRSNVRSPFPGDSSGEEREPQFV